MPLNSVSASLTRADVVAEQSGDKTKAMAYYRKLNVLTAKTDSDWPEIRAARAYVVQQ